jgi:hypothetical protein
VTRAQVEAALPRPARFGNPSRRRLLNGIEDFLFIGGDRLPVTTAAARLGVCKRTIERYRRVLRETGAGPAGRTP